VDLVLVQAGQALSDINAQLAPATGKISGRVTDTSGNGIANAIVAVLDSNGGLLYGTHTDSNGYYSIPVPDGTYKILFNPWATDAATGYYVQKYFPDLITIGGGQSISNINAQLESAGAISGRVTDVSGNGIANMRVYVYGAIDSVPDVRTDADGYYFRGSLPAGSYSVWFRGSDSDYVNKYYNNKAYFDYNNADAVVVAVLNTTTDIDAVLEQGGSISGRVTD
jgi:hypothetical protein